jgi:tripartite-type tricarboxylate transporter receptor subunit TctC
MNRKSLERLAKLALIAVLSISFASGAVAQGYPNKPVTIIAAFPPGGTVDLLSRALSQKLSESWKRPVLVENRPGASGIIGSQYVAKAAPDGYTLLVIPITHVTNASLYSKLPFDPIRDFTPISLLAKQPIMLVANESLPIKTVNDLITYARAHPGKLNCGSGGNGTSQHLACELFKSMAHVDIKHIPYKGNAGAMTDVIGGQIELLFDQMATAVPHVKGGRVTAIAVTSSARSPAMPNVPTIAESGVPGYEVEAWFGVVGPAGMPVDLVARIQAEFAKALAQPDVKERLSSQGLDLIGGSPSEFAALLNLELGKWAKVIKESGARLD